MGIHTKAIITQVSSGPQGVLTINLDATRKPTNVKEKVAKAIIISRYIPRLSAVGMSHIDDTEFWNSRLNYVKNNLEKN
jgi:hypothetical protein